MKKRYTGINEQKNIREVFNLLEREKEELEEELQKINDKYDEKEKIK